MRGAAVLLSLLALGSAGPARAQAAEQLKAINTLARGLAYERSCPQYNMEAHAGLAALAAVDLEGNDVLKGGRFHEIFYNEAARLKRSYDEVGNPELICSAAEMFFGPNGTQVPGLLKRKLASVPAAPTPTPTNEQMRVINHIALATALATRCNDVELSRPTAGNILGEVELSRDDVLKGGRFDSLSIVQSLKWMADLRDADPQALCAQAWAAFGPEGRRVPALLKRK